MLIHPCLIAAAYAAAAAAAAAAAPEAAAAAAKLPKLLNLIMDTFKAIHCCCGFHPCF